MNLKIIGLAGLMAIATYPTYVVADTETQEVDEIEEFEDFDEYEEDFEDDFDDTEDFDEINEEPDDDSVDVSDTTVGTRSVLNVTCQEIAEQIKDLEKKIKSDPELQSKLDMLKQTRKRQCGQTGRNRPVRNYNNVAPMPKAEPVSVNVEPEPMQAPEPKPEKPKLTKKEMADNLSRGLCGDGTKPNKFGCCAGESFKDMGNLKFMCCSKENKDDCHEPLKK
ncbi:MAG: hypothetical protein IJR92_01650 [Alphaproteobacteria bacterium]|nr:hypothetical protein [Alphaproteobacteria bacterium]